MLSTLTKTLLFLTVITVIGAVGEEKDETQLYSADDVGVIYKAGLQRLMKNASTKECRNKIEIESMRYLLALLNETPLPFEDNFFHSQCPSAFQKQDPLMPVYSKIIPNAVLHPNPPVANKTPILPEDIAILYIILVHDHSSFVERIVDALDELHHTFVIHVDLKAPDVRAELLHMTQRSNVFIVGEEQSQRVNWGGYSVVNATMQSMKYGWQLERPFHYMQLLSGTSYPIKSNADIRTEFARKPGAINMDVFEEPSIPDNTMWFHYVECDDRLHRINRLSVIRGMHMHVGSQWFSLPKHVVQWFLEAPLPLQYQSYAEHVVVADENYFSTLVSNSPYCADITRKKNLFLLFDKWENELSEAKSRDIRKCLSPDPDHCGRSPSTLTIKFKSLLEITRALFARKFDPKDVDSLDLLEVIDSWRNSSGVGHSGGDKGHEGQKIMIRFSGLRPEELPMVTSNKDHEAMDMTDIELDSYGNEVQGLSDDRIENYDFCWEVNGMREPLTLGVCDASLPSQWFHLGPCTRNSNVTFIDGHCPVIQPGQDEMFCQLQSSAGDLCVDLAGESPSAGSKLIGWECTGQWNQLFRLQPNCTVALELPEVVGKVRGLQSHKATFCFEPQRNPALNSDGEQTANIVSADCLPPVHPLVQMFINRNSTLNRAEREMQKLRKFQTFSFMKDSGEAYKVYGMITREKGKERSKERSDLSISHPGA